MVQVENSVGIRDCDDFRRRRRIDVDSQGKRIDVDYVCPKDQTEYTPKSSSRPNRIYHSASFDWNLCLHSRCHSN